MTTSFSCKREDTLVLTLNTELKFEVPDLLIIYGKHGIGKTELARKLAQQYSHKCSIIYDIETVLDILDEPTFHKYIAETASSELVNAAVDICKKNGKTYKVLQINSPVWVPAVTLETSFD